MPAKLEELAPRYIAALPIDPFSGEPVRYDATRGLLGRSARISRTTEAALGGAAGRSGGAHTEVGIAVAKVRN